MASKSRKKNPPVLVIEGGAENKTIVLALCSLESNNNSLKDQISATGCQISKLRRIIGDL